MLIFDGEIDLGCTLRYFKQFFISLRVDLSLLYFLSEWSMSKHVDSNDTYSDAREIDFHSFSSVK